MSITAWPTRRLRRQRLLIVGCGDVGQRVLALLGGRMQVLTATSSAARVPELRAIGATPIVANLDEPATLSRLAAVAPRVLYLAPPPSTGDQDPRTAALVRVLRRGGTARHLVYGSTTGVYGDAGGAWIDETRAVTPATARARRRVDAEQCLRRFGRDASCGVAILRIPGIYARDRDGGDPVERVARAAPVLRAEDDVYTNHIHADDLARACLLALFRTRAGRIVNVCDDSERLMGDHYDRVADLAGLPRPPRISRQQAREQMSPMQLSFLGESRRIHNRRMKSELKLVLRYPDVDVALAPRV